MRLRHTLVALAVATFSVVGISALASAAPLTKQSFTLTQDINGVGGTVVASGAINATGQDVVVSDTEDQFVFPDGTLTVIHVPVRSKDHFNDRKCTGKFRETGTYIISAGTDAYAGITGSGDYTAVGSIANGCVGTPTGSVTITASGSINLPTS